MIGRLKADVQGITPITRQPSADQPISRLSDYPIIRPADRPYCATRSTTGNEIFDASFGDLNTECVAARKSDAFASKIFGT